MRTAEVSFARNFPRHRGMRVNGGNMYEWWWVQGIGRASTALTPVSGPQLQYVSNSTFVLDANRPIEKLPSVPSNFKNTILFSLQSLESTRWHDIQSALMFSTPGRCSAWRVTSL